MANWNNPTLSSEIPDFLNEVKGRDEDLATMFDQGVFSSIPENSIRFNVASGVFQRREGGSWVTKTLSNDALGDVLTGAGSFGSSIAIPQLTINSKGRITAAGTNTVRSASTSQTGVVQLNNTTNNTSTTQAATANSVKMTKDVADSAQSTADAASNKATPKTLTGATTNSSDGSGHSHNLNISDLPINTFNFYDEFNSNISGDGIVGGKIHGVKIGNSVNLTTDSTDIGFTSGLSTQTTVTTDAIVPVDFRPTYTVRSAIDGGITSGISYIVYMDVNPNGTLSFFMTHEQSNNFNISIGGAVGANSSYKII